MAGRSAGRRGGRRRWRSAPPRSASTGASGGRIEGNRLAASDLPAPGGPTISRLCPPAAATSSACRRCGWPRRSARSGAPGAGSRRSGSGSGRGGSHSPATSDGSCPNPSTAITSISPASAASAPFSAGRTIASAPLSRAASAIASAPCTGLVEPSSASSPTSATRASPSHSSCPEALSSPAAIARSIPGPALRRLAGARLTTMRRSGNSKPQLTIAARTRSRASRTAASGNPTMVKFGSPRWTSTSTRTGRAAMPSRVKVRAVASTEVTLGGLDSRVARRKKNLWRAGGESL